MAAVPQSTVRTTGGGITTYVGNFVNATTGYYMGTNQIISPTRAATFTTMTLSGDLLNTYNVTQTLQYPQQPASYIISTDGTTIYAKNGTTGAIDYSGTNAATVINAALTNLSPIRTWMESIKIIGEYTTTASLNIQSNTIVKIDGQINQGYNGHLITISGDNITIIGGKLVGNKAVYNADLWNGIVTSSTTHRELAIYNVELVTIPFHKSAL